VALVDQDGGLGDVEALDGRVEEVPAHVGDHPGDDLVAVGLGRPEAGGVLGGGQPGPGKLAGQHLAATAVRRGRRVLMRCRVLVQRVLLQLGLVQRLALAGLVRDCGCR
jgi:hypothetical protein